MSGISSKRADGGTIVREAERLDRELSINRLLWHLDFSIITLVKQQM